MRALVLCCAFASGCFPYREVYRPALSGIVRAVDGSSVANAQVVSCSESRWRGMAGCPRAGATRTDASGQFHLGPVVEWEWCCLGEAPLPVTVLVACVKDGRVAVGGPELVLSSSAVVEPRDEGPVARCRAELERQ